MVEEATTMMTKTMKPRRAQTQRALNKLDREIERIYYKVASGVQLSILDIPKVFAAGHAAARAEGDVEAAVVAAVAALRVN
jgi:hypothetical protein